MTVVYVSCETSGELRVLHLDAGTGSLTPVQCLAHGGQLMPMALSPDRRFLYAARRSEPREVLSHAIIPTDGTLTLIGTAPLPDSMAHIATDRSGRLLFAASYDGGLITLGRIGADGVAGPVRQTIGIGAKAHSAQADPSNRHVYATSLGAGVVRQFRLDASIAGLAPEGSSTIRPHPGASPRHLTFSSDGRLVYVLGELDGAIDVLARDAKTGTLRTLQTVDSLRPGFDTDPWAADLHLTPDGRFLYASERRSSTLAGFRVDPGDGTLTLLGHTVVDTQPRGFGITPDGRCLIVAGQRSNTLGVYAIDASTGGLELRSRQDCGRGPNWVETRMLA